MSKNLDQLTEKTDLEANDVFHIVRNGIDYKQKRSTLLPLKKTYRALLTQTGISAPTVTVLENTIGTIAWSYLGVGNYKATLTGAFTANKTLITAGTVFQNEDYTIGVDANDMTANDFEVWSFDETLTASNGVLKLTPILIEVYP